MYSIEHLIFLSIRLSSKYFMLVHLLLSQENWKNAFVFGDVCLLAFLRAKDESNKEGRREQASYSEAKYFDGGSCDSRDTSDKQEGDNKQNRIELEIAQRIENAVDGNVTHLQLLFVAHHGSDEAHTLPRRKDVVRDTDLFPCVGHYSTFSRIMKVSRDRLSGEKAP